MTNTQENQILRTLAGTPAARLPRHLKQPSTQGFSRHSHFLREHEVASNVTCCKSLLLVISNGNRSEWSPIRSVIIRVINKIGRPRSGCPICLITSMITDQIVRHEALLPINHNINKICNIIGYFLNQNTRNSKFCFASSEKKKGS